MISLRLIGYWRSEREPDWPDPNDFVDLAWDDDERWVVGEYLSSGTVLAATAGRSDCRICGEANGSLEYTDGRYVWPEGLAHYVKQHSVRLPKEVVDHAVSRSYLHELPSIDSEWWNDQMRS